MHVGYRTKAPGLGIPVVWRRPGEDIMPISCCSHIVSHPGMHVMR